MTEQSTPYRTPEPVTVELTDSEITFWDRAFASVVARPPFGASPKEAADFADRAVKCRRERFGVR